METVKITDPELTPRETELLKETRRIWTAREEQERELEAKEKEERRRRRELQKKIAYQFIQINPHVPHHEGKKVTVEIFIKSTKSYNLLTLLEKIGVRKEQNGHLRIRPPWRNDITGLWINPEVLKAYLAGFLVADSVQAKVIKTLALYECLGFQESETHVHNMCQKIHEEQERESASRLIPYRIGTIMLATALGIFLCNVALREEGTNGEMEKIERCSEETPLKIHQVRSTAPDASSPDASVTSPHILKEGDRVWNIVADRLKKKLGDRCKKHDILRVTRIVCERNSIRDLALGILKGRHTSRQLSPGFPLDLRDLE